MIVLLIVGKTHPVKIKFTVDAEKSSEESAYKVTWFSKSHIHFTELRDKQHQISCADNFHKLYLPNSSRSIIGHINFGIIFFFIGNSRLCLYNTQSILNRYLSLSQEYCNGLSGLIDWLVVGKYTLWIL